MIFLELQDYTQFGVDHMNEIYAAAQTGCDTASKVLIALEDVQEDYDGLPTPEDIKYALALHDYIAAHYPEMLGGGKRGKHTH